MKKIIIVLCMMLMGMTPIYAQEKSLTTYVGALNCFAVDDDVTLKIDKGWADNHEGHDR